MLAGCRPWSVDFDSIELQQQAKKQSEMSEALDRHYDAVASRYQEAWFYEDGTDYQRWLAQQLAVR